jgi:uncharacterized protein (TIGR03118 family)
MGLDISLPTRRIALVGAAVLAVPLIVAHSAGADPDVAARAAFTEVDLIADVAGHAPLVDAGLINPWGLALGATGPLWVADNGSDTATIYPGGAGGTPVTKAGLTVAIPGGAPTGQVANGTSDFVVTGPGGSGPARFIFVSESGDLTAWNPTASAPSAIVESHVDGAVYKGLAMFQSTSDGPFLLAADFNHGRIDVFDKQFQRLQLSSDFFNDRALPRGYAPFNVAVVGDAIYVSYAKQSGNGVDQTNGPSLGIVDRFDAFGLFPHRIATHGTLNAPWGMTLAPASFGPLAGDLLVGNFGDGRINVFDPRTGAFHGQLRGPNHRPITIDGLWGLQPGTASSAGTDSLWFSAGPDDEAHGLVGVLRPAM